ncbi:MAG: 5'/3'-nucleotidase SurE [Planctomycetota bacterium]
MRVLLTNDDGYEAPGLAALRGALGSPEFAQGFAGGEDVEVIVVAPSRVQSAMGHAVTLHRPVEVSRRASPYPGHAVSGRPADCVKLALHKLDLGPVDLVVSGMNAGANVGFNVFYSGTVGAAREAAFLGLPAVAVSLHLRDRMHDHWDRAAQEAVSAMVHLGRDAVERAGLTTINVPVLDGGVSPQGVAVCPMSLSPLRDAWEDAGAGEAGPLYQAGPGMRFHAPEPGSDVAMLFEGWVTATPLSINPTDAAALHELTQVSAETAVAEAGEPDAESCVESDGGA